MPASISLEQTTWGNHGRPFLIVHGLSNNSDGWWRVGPALAEAGFRVTAVDLRGHGQSDKPDDYSMDAYAADLLALDATWEVVLGHSLGGSAVIQALVEQPSWCERVILEDPLLAIFDVDLALEYVLADFGPDVTLDMVAENNPTWHPEDTRIKFEAQQQAGREVIESSILHNPGLNLVGALASLELPILLLGADPELGALVEPALGESLAGMNEHIEFHTVMGGSHSMHRDEFDEFMRLVVEFSQ